jgi:hypothetical protein
MIIAVLFYPNFYHISNRLVSIAENRQKTVEIRPKAVKIRPSAAPISTKRILVTFDSYIPNFKSPALTVLEIFCLQTDTHTQTNG